MKQLAIIEIESGEKTKISMQVVYSPQTIIIDGKEGYVCQICNSHHYFTRDQSVEVPVIHRFMGNEIWAHPTCFKNGDDR